MEGGEKKIIKIKNKKGNLKQKSNNVEPPHKSLSEVTEL
jgi:hypothetical protein